MNTFSYNGFIGSIEADSEAKCLYGKLLYISDLVTYEADTVVKLEKEFKISVDEYLETCKELNKEPMKPFKGSLNVRIGLELHKEAAIHAARNAVSLNEYIKTAIQEHVHRC